MEKVLCHGDTRFGSEFEWREPDPAVRSDGYEGRPFRTCGYCGSIHPDDLIAAIKAGARLGGSDWKYGWPHKFYVYDIPNPHAGKHQVKVGSRSYMKDGVRVEESDYALIKPTTHAKWYNIHLKDMDDAKFAEMSELLFTHASIKFARDEKGIKYSAPCDGYQK